MVCIDAKIVPKKLTFDYIMDALSVNTPFDLLSDMKRSYTRMCSDDIYSQYESTCQTPECLRNDQTTYGNLFNDAAIDVCFSVLMRPTLTQLRSRSKFSMCPRP